MIEGVNDSLEQAAILARQARRIHAKVNLIPYNTASGLDWKRPLDTRCRAFRDVLKNAGVTAATTARQLAHETITRTGGIGLVVDAAHDQAALFYARFGFKPVSAGGLRLFLPAKSLEGGATIPRG